MGVLEMLFGRPAVPAPPQPRVEEMRLHLTDLLEPRPGRIYLPIQRDIRAWALEQPGAKADPATGDVYIEAGKEAASSLEPYLPVAYRPGQPGIEVNLIPSSSWGASLSKLLSWRSWSKLRQPVIDAWGGRCCVCGGNERLADPEQANRGRAKDKGVDCHEIWQYDDERGVQKLTGLVPVCDACHECYHLGLATENDRGGEAGARLAAINGWTLPEAAATIAGIFEDHGVRSRHAWALDLSLVAKHRLYFKDDRGLLVKVIGARIFPGKERPRYGEDGRIFLDVPKWHNHHPALVEHLKRGSILAPPAGLRKGDPRRRYALAPPPTSRGIFAFEVLREWAAPWMILEGRTLANGLVLAHIEHDPFEPPMLIPVVSPAPPGRGSGGAEADPLGGVTMQEAVAQLGQPAGLAAFRR